MTHWTIPSVPPHDFFLCLDIDQYFDHEHEPMLIFEQGFTRPIPVAGRDVLMTIRFNGDPENPEFSVSVHDALSEKDKQLATIAIRRILGCDLDLKPLYEAAENDPVLGPKIREFYGFKRMSRANFFEDAVNRIIQTQISHKPTARKMVYGVREGYGQRLDGQNGPIASWPRPEQLAAADPEAMKKYGLSLRKGEYIVGLAQEIVNGGLDTEQLEMMSPEEFYDRVTQIRGIGPTSAQDLMLYRGRPDAFFPSRLEKGVERGLRFWILLSYGADPGNTSESTFNQIISAWKEHEACALEYLFADWVVSEKRKAVEKARGRK
jgi:3-methyladenine DNA glycosylase/8-oxoguanine DNA glycosylase